MIDFEADEAPPPSSDEGDQAYDKAEDEDTPQKVKRAKTMPEDGEQVATKVKVDAVEDRI